MKREGTKALRQKANPRDGSAFLRPLAAHGLTALLSSTLAACSSSASGERSRNVEVVTLRDAGPSSSSGDTSGEPPELAGLTVAPLELVPEFSPAIHDYYVRCATGANPVSLSVTAAEADLAAIKSPKSSAPAGSTILPLSLYEDDAIVVDVSDSVKTTSYWVRCLPHDFPHLAVTRPSAAGTAAPGYYLLGNALFVSGQVGYAMALDGNGVPVWYHATATGQGAVDVDVVLPRTISFVPYLEDTFGGTSGAFELHAVDTGKTTTVTPVAQPLNLHELQVAANGDYLVITNPISEHVDLTGLENFGADVNMMNCNVQEIDPQGRLVWSWAATDHFDPVQASTWPQQSIVEGRAVVDPFHCNAIDVDTNGDLLVSSRHMDSIFLVSRVTGVVLWKMGGARSSKDGAPYIQVVDDTFGGFFRQHDARFQASGQISVFDDETGIAKPARALLLSYNVTAGTANVDWQYQGKSASSAMGSFRVMADGSKIIGWGFGSTDAIALTEISPAGAELLDIAFPDGDVTYRALKVPLSTLDLDGLRRTAGGK